MEGRNERMEGKNRNTKQESTDQQNFKYLCHLSALSLLTYFFFEQNSVKTLILCQALRGAGNTGLDLTGLFVKEQEAVTIQRATKCYKIVEPRMP